MDKTETTKRKLSAVMFVDLQDFSRKMQEDEARTLKILKKYDSLVSLGVRVYEGSIVKMVGDGFLIDFSSAVNAVQCALALQRTALDYNKERPENERILMRIGIHTGDVVMMENDIMGDAVNVASRIQAYARAGGICISPEVNHQIQGRLDVATASLGLRALKNIKELVEVFEVPSEAIQRFSPALPSQIPLSRRLATKNTRTFAVGLLLILLGNFVGRIVAGNINAAPVAEAARSGIKIRSVTTGFLGNKREIIAEPTGIEGDYKVVTVQIVRNGKVVDEEVKKVPLK